MFRKVLVANRGEIAVRVIRTLREMGIASVAIHSEVDTSAHHVRLADESRCLGGAAPAENYLDVGAIVAAARDTGAEAVHPGYGFLAESPALPRALAAAGVAFIGPPPEVLARVGDKLQARALMKRAGLPVVPGAEVASGDLGELRRAAEQLGYPVMIKAAAGGGGKGMRRVDDPSALEGAAREAAGEARAAFSDGRIYLEKLLERPRHVEVQILADARGEVIHLFERECSIQRRHQKVVEESPSPALDDALRARLTEAAVAAARAAGYVNAGTVEFLLDQEGRFYFLEVNARLQVEHPVTELITGLDLVRLQLELAAGASLPFGQDQISRRGHAIECRIYAEDAEKGFAPSPGRVSLLRAPQGPGVRFDEGLLSGGEVPGCYDPILAKLSVWAQDRQAACARCVRALGELVILGVRTPAELLRDLISSEEFRSGQLHTGLLEAFGASWRRDERADEVALIATVARELFRPQGVGRSGESASLSTPWETLGSWDLLDVPAGGRR